MSRFVPEPAPTVPASPSTISDQSSTAQPRIAPGEYTVGVDYSSGLLPPAHPLSTPSRERRTLQETHNNDRDDAGDLEEKAEPASQSEINEQALDKSDGRGWGLRSAIRWGKGLKADPETVASNRSGVGGGITPRRSDVAGTAGLGRREDLGLTTNLGTVAWAAPEMLIAGEGGRGEYTSKVILNTGDGCEQLIRTDVLRLSILLYSDSRCSVDGGSESGWGVSSSFL